MSLSELIRRYVTAHDVLADYEQDYEQRVRDMQAHAAGARLGLKDAEAALLAECAKSLHEGNSISFRAGPGRHLVVTRGRGIEGLSAVFATEFDPEFNCPAHFSGGNPSCPACLSKQPRPAS